MIIMKYARLSSDNSVIEIFTPPSGFSIQECFTPQVVIQFEVCPDEVDQNWTKQPDGSFVAPPSSEQREDVPPPPSVE